MLLLHPEYRAQYLKEWTECEWYDLPSAPGLYAVWEPDGEQACLYVGRSLNLRDRVARSHHVLGKLLGRRPLTCRCTLSGEEDLAIGVFQPRLNFGGRACVGGTVEVDFPGDSKGRPWREVLGTQFHKAWKRIQFARQAPIAPGAYLLWHRGGDGLKCVHVGRSEDLQSALFRYSESEWDGLDGFARGRLRQGRNKFRGENLAWRHLVLVFDYLILDFPCDVGMNIASHGSFETVLASALFLEPEPWPPSRPSVFDDPSDILFL